MSELSEFKTSMINMLRSQSPFAGIEKNSEITNDLIKVYTKFVNDLKNGTIKL